MGVGPWPSPIGRRNAVDAVRAGLAAGGSVLVYGPAGIGKSTVLESVAGAAATEARVLRAAAAEAEADLPYLALVDLFGAAIAEVGAALPAQLRAALDAALLRSAAPATPQDQLAVRLAVLEVLRLLAARRPVLVVIDDVQWVDEPSAGVLGFVARRLAGVPFLVAERVPDGEQPARRGLCPEPCTDLILPPLSHSDVAELLRARFRDALPQTALARASAASGGNPLYAVELGRVLSGGIATVLDPLPVPGRLRQLLSARLAALPPGSGTALLIAAAAARPTRALVARVGAALPLIDAGLSTPESGGSAGVDRPTSTAGPSGGTSSPDGVQPVVVSSSSAPPDISGMSGGGGGRVGPRSAERRLSPPPSAAQPRAIHSPSPLPDISEMSGEGGGGAGQRSAARPLASHSPSPLPDISEMSGEGGGRAGQRSAAQTLATHSPSFLPDITEMSGRASDTSATVDGLAAAEDAGVVVVDAGGAVRFAHPMLREMVYGDADPASRRLVHEELAEVADDPVERARHLALARAIPDEALAGALVVAATVARLRGAPGTAADLARLAADRTRPDAPGLAAARRLEAANHAYAAGRPDAATAYATAALRDATDRATRVGARLLLVDMAEQNQSGVGPLLDAALADAGDDPALLSRVHTFRATKAYYDGDVAAVIAELERAESAAEASGDAERIVDVLGWRATMEARITGRGSDELRERASARSAGLPATGPVVSARQLAAMAKLWQGEVDEAVRRIESVRTDVERIGTVRDLAYALVSVTGIYARAGRCADAVAAARACTQLHRDAITTVGPGLVTGALGEWYGGDAVTAGHLATEGAEASVAAGDDDWLSLAYAVGGQVQHMRGDPVAAVDLMRRAYAMEQRLGRLDPAVVPWHSDFVEALVAVGARAEAAEILTDVRGNAKLYGRPVVELSLARAEAALTAAEDGPRPAAEALAAALDRLTPHPYRVEEARAWHALAILQRRAHRRGAARDTLVEALRRYTACSAEPWRRVALEDLARLDGARGPGLTDTERRIVELVRAGATNREIAASVFLSVKAVEANLTRLYRRLGVRNRAQLARAAASLGRDRLSH